MPYRHAHWYLLALFPLAGLAFWQSYLSQFTSVPAEFHMHGLTATLWLILLIVQSSTIHSGNRSLHRTVGATSLILFPLFLMGGTGIFFGMADRFVQGSPFHVLYAPKLAWFDFVGVGGFAYCYFEALRQRRNVNQHSGYMLATVIFLLPPIFGRLSGIPLGVTGPADFHKLDSGFIAATVLVAGLAFFIAFRSGKHGRPWVLAGVLSLGMIIPYMIIGTMPAWQKFYATLADWPTMPFTLAAATAGFVIAYAGWVSGRRVLPPDALPA